MRLPPPGTNPADVATYVDHLVMEVGLDRNRQDFLDNAEDGLSFYLGDQWDTVAPDDVDRVVLNRVQNCITSLVAIQAGDPPKVTFTPRESGDQPLTYLNTDSPDLPMIEPILAQMGLVPGAYDPTQPLPPQIAKALTDYIDQNNMAALAGLAPAIDKTVLAEVTDQTVAEALQTIYDGMWESSDCQRIFVENVTNKNIFGWQPTLYEFDDDLKQHICTNVHPKQVFIDPLTTDSMSWQYAIFDQPVSADEAKSRWPQFAQQIDEHARQGVIIKPGNQRYTAGIPYQQQFYRDMLYVRTAWFRYQPYPMSPDEAVGNKHVGTAELPTGEMEQVADDQGMPVMDPATGQPAYQNVTRTAMVHPTTGEELTPAHPAWPMRYGIRQVTIVANMTVGDQECEHCDIPLPVNKNIPIPFSPYGQGEPTRLRSLQQSINKLISAMVTHHKYTAYPAEAIPASVAERMGLAMQDVRTKPGQRVIIPDDLLETRSIKDVLMTLDVPTMPADFWQLLNLLITLIDKEGNQSDVTQGNASATWSGEAIKSLQTAASQIIQGKSLYTEFYLKKLARLMVYSITNRMGPEDWRKYISHVPIQALQAMHDKAKQLDVDISVQIKSGSGSSKAAQAQQIMAARQMQLPVSDPTVLEQLGLDPDSEQTKQIDWLKKQQRAANSLAPAQPANNSVEAGESQQEQAQEQQPTGANG